jgi:AcrR family transcriptional regulator
VPTLWTDTIETHRRQVHDAILDTTAGLAAEHGVLAVTMSQIAKRTGIGRATLYKYFSSVEEILHAWHDRQVGTHLALLRTIHDSDGPVADRLTAFLTAYADIQSQRHDHSTGPHGHELAALLHRHDHIAPAERELHTLLRDLLTQAATAGDARSDVPAAELATFCLHALDAAHDLPSKAAVQRLTRLTNTAVLPRD